MTQSGTYGDDISLMLETKQDIERARERLRRRDPESLVEFLMSLAGDSGPVGEQIRTFVVGDDVTQTVASLRRRIQGLRTPSEYEFRHAYGREIGMALDLIVDSVERLVLRRDPRAAFEVLVALFEADANSMENCGEHHWKVECAYKRAAIAMSEAAKHFPLAEVRDRLTALLNTDSYGVRACLETVSSDTLPPGEAAAP